MTNPRHHILFISSWYPNRNNPTHGIFNKAFAHAASLYNKVSVLHVCSDENLNTGFEMVESAEENINTVTVYYKKVRSLPLLAQLQKRRRLLQAFEMGYKRLVEKTGAPQLMQLNVVMPAGIGVYQLSQKYHLPYVINEGWSGYCPEDGNYKGLVMKYFTRRIIAKARAVMPVSKHLQSAMLAYGLQGNYHIVPNVVDTQLFSPKKMEEHRGIRFIHISTLDDSQKNVSGIIRAFSHAIKKDPGMELVIVGESENKSELAALAERLGCGSKIRFTGRLMGTELANELNESDALVMFSNYETFCLTVAEALAGGKPVITSRAGGLTDHITAELGIMIDKKNEGALTEALLRFKTIQQNFNPDVLRRFITDHYTAEKIGQQLSGIYQSVLNPNS
jgi:glycosyltransferase involved in cell wall biosynthesis